MIYCFWLIFEVKKRCNLCSSYMDSQGSIWTKISEITGKGLNLSGNSPYETLSTPLPHFAPGLLAINRDIYHQVYGKRQRQPALL